MAATRFAIESQLLRTLKVCKGHGLTVREFLYSEIVPGAHHGQVSAVFSNLHRDGVIECLSARRSGYCIYVMPRHARGLPKRPHASVRRLSRREVLLLAADDLRNAVETTDEHPYGSVDMAADALLKEIDRQYR